MKSVKKWLILPTACVPSVLEELSGLASPENFSAKDFQTEQLMLRKEEHYSFRIH